MPGPTMCPFCRSSRIRPRLPVQGLHEYECKVCARTWLVARPKRQARIVEFPVASERARRRAGSGSGK
jgi:transposase-like protein